VTKTQFRKCLRFSTSRKFYFLITSPGMTTRSKKFRVKQVLHSSTVIKLKNPCLTRSASMRKFQTSIILKKIVK
jgi:hypothetical protein